MYVEDLKVKNMTASAKGTVANPGKNVKQKSGLNRAILRTGFYSLRQTIEWQYMVSSPFASVREIFWVQLPLEGAPMRVLHPIRGEATPLNL